ncbi:hypothetical protein GCK72_007892 [Caenorhabditis remanei]|uniref:Uncharacterized protein n=1 Tax=Caenorhabditis remanei TaxID=31234 RepID=A0A6A5HQ44_CAERE|nr:hypothetical protein GCK72_007892 [Caenorhabditis remanei]KAF1767932.1 hypothetical protein GCK72_007892 [Caenorhabditis remanei]
MPLPLSYPGLKCILEHLEVVKRVHIIGRSPGLQKIDKLIPRCFENLHIGKWKLVINKLWITCNEDEIETKKATGTTLVIAADDKGFIKKMLRKFKKAFGEYRSTLDGVNERFLSGSSKFSIPINNESRIQVYAIEDPELFKDDFPYNIIVKSVPEISRI